MVADHEALMWAEVEDMGGLLHDCSDDELDVASLCDGWRVKDVIGHMCLGHTTPMPTVLVSVLRYRGNIPKASFELSKSFADDRSPDELRRFWDDEMIARHPRKGISRTIAYPDGFLDHLIHNQDMRRPLGKPRNVPSDRLVAALELLPQVDSKMFSTAKAIAGLRLEATDVDWSGGDGPTVSGPGEALVLAAAGRRVALDELDGDGVRVLADRLA